MEKFECENCGTAESLSKLKPIDDPNAYTIPPPGKILCGRCPTCGRGIYSSVKV